MRGDAGPALEVKIGVPLDALQEGDQHRRRPMRERSRRESEGMRKARKTEEDERRCSLASTEGVETTKRAEVPREMQMCRRAAAIAGLLWYRKRGQMPPAIEPFGLRLAPC